MLAMLRKDCHVMGKFAVVYAFGWMGDVPVPALAAGIAGLLLALHLFSFLLSVRFYTRRRRGWYD